MKHLETSWNSLKHLETSWNSSAWWKCSGWVNRCRCHHIRRLGFQRTLRLIWRVQTWEDTQRKLNRTSQKCWVYWKTEFFLWKTPISYHIIGYSRKTPIIYWSYPIWNDWNILWYYFCWFFLMKYVWNPKSPWLWRLYKVTVPWYNAGSTVNNYASLTGGSRMFKHV